MYVQALKYDLANSLQNRLSLLVEDEVEVNGEFKLPIMPFFAWGLPRRVFIDIGDMYVYHITSILHVWYIHMSSRSHFSSASACWYRIIWYIYMCVLY